MIRKATSNDFPTIITIWEASVRATHDFLPEEYLQHIKHLLPSILPEVNSLYVMVDESDNISGFLGTADDKLEMLFIDPHFRGKGIGRELTQFAVTELSICKVDVNEQNLQAVGFYQKFGFTVFDRSEKDGLGKPFPLLHMVLKQ